MKLTVENIGKIHRSEILLDGLTVIAGPNNSGKSTVGQALFALANSQFNFPKKVMARNKRVIRQAIQDYLSANEQQDYRITRERRFSMGFQAIDFISGEMSSYFLGANETVSESEVRNWLILLLDKLTESESDYPPRMRRSLIDIVNTLCNEDEQTVQLRTTCAKLFNDSETAHRKYFAQKCFTELFGGQVESVKCPEGESSTVSLQTDDSTPRGIWIDFESGICKSASANLTSQEFVLFIDDLNLLDSLDDRLDRLISEQISIGMGATRYSKSKTSQFADALVRKMRDKTRVWTAEDHDKYKNDCQKIIDVLADAHKGSISSNDDGAVVLEEFDSNEQILLSNVSVGVKAIELLKEMLKNGALDEDTFLVLDEPEIHLHPEWQIIYAHASVMIADLLHTKIMVTTHSPYFLQAIDVYTAVHGKAEMVRTYTPREYSKTAVDFVEVSGADRQQILDKMAEPFEDLQQLLLQHEL